MSDDAPKPLDYATPPPRKKQHAIPWGEWAALGVFIVVLMSMCLLVRLIQALLDR